MKRSTFAINIILLIFSLVMLVPVLSGCSFETWSLEILFIIISFALITRNLEEKIEGNFIPIFAFVYFYVYMIFSQVNLLYNGRVNEETFIKVQCVLIIALVALAIGRSFGKRIFVKSSNVLDFAPAISTYYILLLFALLVKLLQIMSAGGFSAYFNSSYQGKYSSVNTEKALGGLEKLAAPFTYFNIMYISDKEHRFTSMVAKVYFFANIIFTYASGSSLSILYQLIALTCMQAFGNNDFSIRKYAQNWFGSNAADEDGELRGAARRRKWLLMGVVFVVVGIIAAILIRYNRSSDTFSFEVLNNVYVFLVTTSTFDSLYFLALTLENLSVQWSIGQFIFPFIFWVPRSFFPWKPVELGRTVATTFQNFSASMNGGYAVTPMGEFYYDTGYIGLVLGMLFLGALIVAIQRKLNMGKNKKMRIAAAMMFMFPCASLATSWSSMGSGIVSATFFMIAITVLNKFEIHVKV